MQGLSFLYVQRYVPAGGILDWCFERKGRRSSNCRADCVPEAACHENDKKRDLLRIRRTRLLK